MLWLPDKHNYFVLKCLSSTMKVECYYLIITYFFPNFGGIKWLAQKSHYWLIAGFYILVIFKFVVIL